MRVIIDRFEERFAVVELPDGSMCNMPRQLVPDASEGDVIDISVNTDETLRRKTRIDEKLKRLFDN